MKKANPFHQSHTSKSKIGHGDYTGTAVKAKVGKIRSLFPVDNSPISNEQLGKPPKALA